MGLGEFDAIAKSGGIAFAVLVLVCGLLIKTVRVLHSENAELHERLEKLTERRAKALEFLFEGQNPPPRGGARKALPKGKARPRSRSKSA